MTRTTAEETAPKKPLYTELPGAIIFIRLSHFPRVYCVYSASTKMQLSKVYAITHDARLCQIAPATAMPVQEPLKQNKCLEVVLGLSRRNSPWNLVLHLFLKAETVDQAIDLACVICKLSALKTCEPSWVNPHKLTGWPIARRKVRKIDRMGPKGKGR
jgi:hypothetical protein